MPCCLLPYHLFLSYFLFLLFFLVGAYWFFIYLFIFYISKIQEVYQGSVVATVNLPLYYLYDGTGNDENSTSFYGIMDNSAEFSILFYLFIYYFILFYFIVRLRRSNICVTKLQIFRYNSPTEFSPLASPFPIGLSTRTDPP
jgi:hypothetical protein